jgi:hypothetical protein
MSSKSPVTFTPANEPYLGRPSLHVFDDIIIACLKSNERAAPYTHNIEKTGLQSAACLIIPSGIRLSLSIRELIRQGYLYGALVLTRSLAERSIMILYLQQFPEAVQIWQRGWSHAERPSLSKMLTRIGGDKFPNFGPELTRSMNSLTHGDPASAMWTLIDIGDGQMGHAVSKILDRPDFCDRVSGDAAVWMSVLLGMMHAIFSDAFVS